MKIYARAQRGTLKDAYFLLDPNINVFVDSSSSKNSNSYIRSAIASNYTTTNNIPSSSSIPPITSSNSATSYHPTKKRYQLKDLHYSIAKECMLLRNIPVGDHILTIMTDPISPDTVASLSHIVVF